VPDDIVDAVLFGPIADSYMIERTVGMGKDWLAPDMTWTPSIFEGARIELEDVELVREWLAGIQDIKRKEQS